MRRTKNSKAPKIALAPTRRGTRQSTTAPRKLARTSPKAAPLGPNDPLATNIATMPGPNGIGNVVETNTTYAMGQEDRCVVVVGAAATITLPTEPLLGYPVYIVADGGAVTVDGPIQNGTATINQGTIGVFVYSSQSGLWSNDQGTGSQGSTGATGATGIQGATGIAGATGPTVNALTIVTVTGPATQAVSAGVTYEANATGGAIVFTTSGLTGTQYFGIIRIDSTGNSVTIDAQVGGTIQDPTTYAFASTASLPTQNQSGYWYLNGTVIRLSP